MGKLAIWAVVLSACVACSCGCFQCLVDVDDSLRLCWGHVLSKYGVRNMDSCFRTIDRIFNHEQKVLQAGRVGGGYDRQLRNILQAEIMPLVEEFAEKLNADSVYEERLQAAAGRFIAAASKLPRATGCVPPCGFQVSGAVYNCVTCQYDSCEYPLDCPMVGLTVGESNSTEMRCDVQFPLPSDIEVIWRFAPEVRTLQVEQFGLVTVGEDRLYSISSARPHHQGTYQCEVFSLQRSIVRTYQHLTVIPLVLGAQARLQGVFDVALLPGGQVPAQPVGPPRDLAPTPSSSLPLLPSPPLMAACLTTLLLLLLLLTLGYTAWWMTMTRDQAPRIIQLLI
ncbi:sperm acrosome associated 6 [Conger conger]|uniref:sperm acrosome associated 6 n=1 Tax=Conger conger TaxID=82655 RepID=UPI002A5A27CD|nr:sperm acrosome associated 6 [Conger conger]